MLWQENRGLSERLRNLSAGSEFKSGPECMPPRHVLWSNQPGLREGRASPRPARCAVPVGNPGASAVPCRLEYLEQKRSRVTSEADRAVLEKQSQAADREIQEIK